MCARAARRRDESRYPVVLHLAEVEHGVGLAAPAAAAGRVDVQDVGALVREHLRREWARDVLAEVDDAQAVERQPIQRLVDRRFDAALRRTDEPVLFDHLGVVAAVVLPVAVARREDDRAALRIARLAPALGPEPRDWRRIRP